MRLAIQISSAACAASIVCFAPAALAWKPATPAVAEAAKQPVIAAALTAVDAIDKALVTDDTAAFAASLASDLVVNNPQNAISEQGATVAMNLAGRIAYTSYERIIEHAGLRGDMVLLMGEENVVPKAGPMAGKPVKRRFTDLWRLDGGRWVLTARQATIIS